MLIGLGVGLLSGCAVVCRVNEGEGHLRETQVRNMHMVKTVNTLKASQLPKVSKLRRFFLKREKLLD